MLLLSRIKLLLLCIPLALATPSHASNDDAVIEGLQIHGFASLAHIVSKENQLHGKSTSGSGDFHELGLNASWQPNNWLQLSVQAVSTGGGTTRESAPELDYYTLDWRPYDSGDQNFGIRIGRVRLPQGLHNDTRDVASARPGIFMPQSIYLDGLRLRELLFAQKGAQIYWEKLNNDSEWRADAMILAKQEMHSAVETAAFRQDHPGHVDVQSGAHGRLAYETGGGDNRYSLTYNHVYAAYQPLGREPLQSGILNYDQYTLSYQRNYEFWSFTTEFTRRLTDVRLGFSSGGKAKVKYVSLGAYIEARRRFGQGWDAFIRYDELAQKGSDRSGRERSAESGLPRYYSFARDWGLGISKDFGNGISLHGEFHYVDGVETLDVTDNPGYLEAPFIGRYWNYGSIMLAYRF